MNFLQRTNRAILKLLISLPLTIVLLPCHILEYLDYKEFVSNAKVIRMFSRSPKFIVEVILLAFLTIPLIIYFPLFVIWNTITGEQCQVSRWVFGVKE